VVISSLTSQSQRERKRSRLIEHVLLCVYSKALNARQKNSLGGLATMDKGYWYYKSLLGNDTSDLLQSHAEEGEREKLLQKICARFHPEQETKEKLKGGIGARLRAQLHPEQETKQESEDPWNVQVKRINSLILEESRHSIAEALHKRWNSQARYQNGLQLRVQFEEIKEGDPPKTRCRRGVIQKSDIKLSRFFTAQDRKDMMRPGAVVELHPVIPGGRVGIDQVLLGTLSHQVWTKTKMSKRETILHDMKAIELYANENDIPKDGLYIMHPLTSLLSYARQIDASCCLQPALYPTLMSTPSRTVNGKNEEDDTLSRRSSSSSRGYDIPCLVRDEKRLSSPFTIPHLNECQQNASTEFLTSSQLGSITLVQGPPGSGKTTLLIATICNFLLAREAAGNKHPRLMVCAPSNKAVTVLAARYLEAINTKACRFHAALVGDKDKMMSEDRLRFKDIFIYTWVENVVEEYNSICKRLSKRNMTHMMSQAEALGEKLCDKIPEYGVVVFAGLTRSILDKISSFEKVELDKAIEELADWLKGIERGIQGVLMEKANVIFCTLSSAGAMVVKRTDPVEGLVIDESAAAVEPETFIPMAALRPKFIMIVGDPKQLPATIMSQHAKNRGLAKSLQERLMFDEKQPYTMLNVQYRMRPEISNFPSTTFYEGRISNGSNVTSPSYGMSTAYRTLVSDQPYAFIEVDGMETKQPSGSFENIKEAERVVALMMDVRKRSSKENHVRSPGVVPSHPWFSINRVRVITFYKAQVDLISRMLKANGLPQVAVSTVDSSQGSEADLIIISFVRTGKMKSVGFLSDDRRVNVALTRAKYKLICVGNLACLATVQGNGSATIRSLAKDAISKENISKYSPKVRLARAQRAWVPSGAWRQNRFQKRARNSTARDNNTRQVKRRKTSNESKAENTEVPTANP
jgi:hypothetical protein